MEPAVTVVTAAGRHSWFQRGSLLLVRHLQDLLSRVLADEIRMVGGNVSLDVRDHRIIRIAFHGLSARTIDDFHHKPPCLDERDTSAARTGGRSHDEAVAVLEAMSGKATGSGVRS